MNVETFTKVLKQFDYVAIINTHSNTIDALIEAYFEFDDNYELPVVEEASNGISKTYNVDGALSEYDLKEIRELTERKKYKNTHPSVILNYLAFLGHIPTGKYVVDISW